MKTWKRITDMENKLAEEQLQWGHVVEDVEEIVHAIQKGDGT